MGRKYLRQGGRHVPYRDNKPNFTGTVRYISVNANLGIEQSRRDDMEALIHVMIYLAKGYLPWMGMKGEGRREKYDNIQHTKLVTPLDVVCQDLPPQVE